jgi:hypothetical protein
MVIKEELEQVNIIQLAVRCQKVADDSTLDEATAEKAWQLKREWVVLVGRDTPPPDFKMHQQIQEELAELKKRMADFLSTV